MLYPRPWPLTGAEEWMNDPMMLMDDGYAGRPPGGLFLGEEAGRARLGASGYRSFLSVPYGVLSRHSQASNQAELLSDYDFFQLNGTQLMEDLTPRKERHSRAHRLSVWLCSHGSGRCEHCLKLLPECPRQGHRGRAPSKGHLSAESPSSAQSKRSC